MRVQCYDCGNVTEFTLAEWRCSCGGAWEPDWTLPFDIHRIVSADNSIWRYGKLLGLDIQSPDKRMGVGWTPLVPVQLFGNQILLKLEYLLPTGSFKDRGINAMVNQLAHMGVGSMVEDSSGNAGASLAAHGARFGIDTQIFVPDYASPFKQHQISIYGVEITRIAGSRKDTEIAAQAVVGSGKTYASHAYHPAYLAGQTTVAFEVWEQLGQRVPDWIICPVAQGGQFLGFWFGFTKLLEAGLIDHLPRLVAVQSAQVSPLYHAWQAGLDHIPAIQPLGPTIAEGVSIANPVRGKRLLQAVKETDGTVLAINEEEILQGQSLLAHKGYYVEPTSALVVAGLKHLTGIIDEKSVVILPLTGNGLKGLPHGFKSNTWLET
jgi:threonine synthase